VAAYYIWTSSQEKQRGWKPWLSEHNQAPACQASFDGYTLLIPLNLTAAFDTLCDFVNTCDEQMETVGIALLD